MRNFVYLTTCLLILFFSIPGEVIGQRHRKKEDTRRFKVGFEVGFNLSQIDGDRYQGFDKFNPQLTLLGAATISKQTDLLLGITYNQKGCRFNPEQKVGNDQRRKINAIHLSYMEIPVLLRHKFKKSDFGYFLESGFSYGRLFKSKVVQPKVAQNEFAFESLMDEFNNSEWSLILGAGYQITKNFDIKFRYTFALSKLYESPVEREAGHNTSLQFNHGGPGNGRQKKEVRLLRNYHAGLMATLYF